MTGKFIVIEGTDGSGKSTQFKLLLEKLKSKGLPIETIKFPQYSKKSGGLVTEYLNGTYGSAEEVGPYRASIFYACDRFDASFQMREWLKQGKIIVADRYETSNRAYQGQKIKDPSKRKEFFEWTKHLEYEIFGIPKADLIILLHVPVEVSKNLMENREKRVYTDKSHDVHEADEELLRRTEQVYLELAQDPEWYKISCVQENKLRSINDIHEEVYQKVKEFLSSTN